jgi:hypothetical protein
MIFEYDRYTGPTTVPARKSPGQVAYEADCAAMPTYRDGSVRIDWADLPDYAKWSWERNPTPRDWR